MSERAASHEHFIDLCHFVGQPAPAEAGPTRQDYCFEKAVKVVAAAPKGSRDESGFVDVWNAAQYLTNQAAPTRAYRIR